MRGGGDHTPGAVGCFAAKGSGSKDLGAQVEDSSVQRRIRGISLISKGLGG